MGGRRERRQGRPGLARALACAVGLLALVTPSLRAAPAAIGYGGRLSDATGAPIAGPVDLSVQFFAAAAGGSGLLAQPLDFPGTTLANGVFQLQLPLTSAQLDAVFRDGAEPVWVAVTDVTHHKAYPRQALLAVPFALRVAVDGTSVVYDGSGKLSIGSVDAAKVTGLSALLADMGDAAKLLGVPLGTGTPAAGAVLTYQGGQWQPVLDSGVLTQRGNAAPTVAPAGQGRIYFDASSNQFMVSQNGGAYAPLGTVSGGTITQVSAGAGLTGGGTTGNVVLSLPTVGTVGTFTKVLTDAYGRVTASGTLAAADLPPLNLLNGTLAATQVATIPATQISGTFVAAQIPSLPLAQMTGSLAVTQLTGTLTAAQLPSVPVSQLSGTLTTAQLPSIPSTQLSGTLTPAQLPSLSEAQITSGTLSVALGGTGATAFPSGGVVVGAGSLPLSTVATTTQYQVLQQGASGPVFGPLSLDQSAAVTGTLAVASGGTGSGAPLSGNRLMISSAGAIVEAPTLVDVAGSVGIGTASPGALLDVAGTLYEGQATTSGSHRASHWVSSNGSYWGFDANTGAGPYMSLDASGAAKIDAGINGVTLDSHHPNGTISLQINGAEGLRVTTGGYVGLGGVSPGSLLDVAGAVTARGTPPPAVAPASQARLYYDSGSQQLMLSQNGNAYAPLSTGGTITNVTAGTGLTGGGSTGSVTLALPAVGTAGTYARILTDAQGRVTAGSTLTAADLPPHSAALLTSGTLSTGVIPGLPASQITSGTFALSLIPSYPVAQLTGTLAAAQVPPVPATQLTGTVAAAQLTAAGSAGQVQFNAGGIPAADANLFWDNTNKRLGVGTPTPAQKLSVAGTIESTTGGFRFPDGTTQTSAAAAGSAGSAVAWVAFNGANGAISSSFNVSAVTRTAAGHYAITFASTLSDANYAVVFGGANTGSSDGGWLSVDSLAASPKTTTGVKISTFNNAGSAMDYTEAYVAVYQGSGTAPVASGQWTENGASVYRPSGSVGIGSSSPTTTLDVAGAVRVGTSSVTCNASTAGAVRWDGSKNFLGCDGAQWNVLSKTPLKDGASSANAASSCWAILQGGYSTGDGVYWLNVGQGAFQAYCDMTTDGGGWTLAAGINGANQNHDTGNAVTPGNLTSVSGYGKFSDTVINLLKSGVNPAFRLKCNTVTGYWSPVCTFDASGTAEAACTDMATTFGGAGTGVYVQASEVGVGAGNAGTANRLLYGTVNAANGCDTATVVWGNSGTLWVR